MIGIIGPADDPQRSLASNQLDKLDVETTTSTELPTDTTSYTALYLIGTRALSQCAATRTNCPLIPIDTLPIPDSLSAKDVTESIQLLETNEFTTRTLPTLTVTQATQPVTTGLFDLFISAKHVAEIITFDIHTDTLHTQLRADGIAFGTPIGTHGYLNTTGAPTLDYNTAGIVTVPVAHFDLQKPHWLFSPTSTITVDVHQAATPITLLTDGFSTCTIGINEPLKISLSEHLSILTFPSLTPD